MTRRAIVFGSGSFEDPQINSLPGAEPDCRRMAELLREQARFEVQELIGPADCSQASLFVAVKRATAGLQAGDLLLIYVAIHAYATDEGGRQFLVCPKARLKELTHGQTHEAVALTLLEEETRCAGVQRLFLFDACRTSLQAGQRRAGHDEVVFDARNLVAAQADPADGDEPDFSPLTILSACEQGFAAQEIKDLKRGLFTLALEEVIAEHLAAGAGVVVGDAFTEKVRKAMIRLARQHGLVGRQKPSRTLVGPPFELVPRTAPEPVTPPPEPEPAPPAPPGRRKRTRWVPFLGFALVLVGFLGWRTFRDTPAQPADAAGDDRRLQQARDEAVRRLEAFTDLTNTPALRQLESYVEGLTLTLAPEQAEGVRQALLGLRGRVHARQQSDRLDQTLTRLRAQTNDLAPARLLAPELLPQVEQVAAGLRAELGDQPATALATWDTALRRLREDLSGRQRAAAEEAIRQQLDTLPGDATAAAIEQTAERIRPWRSLVESTRQEAVDRRFDTLRQDCLRRAQARLDATGREATETEIVAGTPLADYDRRAAEIRTELAPLPAPLRATLDTAILNGRETQVARRAAAAETLARAKLEGVATATAMSALEGVERELQALRPLLSPVQWTPLEAALAKRRAQVVTRPEAPPPPKAATATKAQPFENSLGMKFVPVVTSLDGKASVLFSVWETRVRDYAAYAAAKAGVDNSWKSPGFAQEDTHPVVDVSWEDAQGFCAWLTAKERQEGKIGPQQSYRLPTDAEWSWAVGIGEAEERAGKGRSPQEKDEKIRAGTHPWVYPWGMDWPPPKGAGNYADESAKRKFSDLKIIAGYDDGYATTSLVGSFGTNAQGLYDLGGNVWEWVEDYYDGKNGSRVLRGGSWYNNDPRYLLSSYRILNGAGFRNYDCGFRLVLVGVSVR